MVVIFDVRRMEAMAGRAPFCTTTEQRAALRELAWSEGRGKAAASA
jgi:hypothetical protein